VLHTEWSEAWGGQEIRIINEMIAIREAGLGVYLACKKNSVILEKAKKHNIKTFILPFRGNVDLKTIFLLIRIIKAEGINIVNTHSGKDTWVGGIAAKLAGVKFIRTRHLSHKINKSRLNFINELADFVFTTGESVRQDMIKNNRILPERIISIPTGVDSDLFDPVKYSKGPLRDQLNIPDEAIVVGIVAVLRDSKRHDVFLDLCLQLKVDFPDRKFKFLIVGDGPMKESIVKYIAKLEIEDDVLMLGHIENIPEVFASLDIFLFTADRREGVPQSVMQALLMNVPTVSTNDGSTADLFFNNNFLISDSKFKNLYKNLNRLICDMEKPNFSTDSRQFIVENFSKQIATKKILECYRKIL